MSVKSSHTFLFSVFIFLAFILQIPALKAESIIEVPKLKRSKESVSPFIGTQYTSEVKKRQLSDNVVFWPLDLPVPFDHRIVSETTLAVAAHYKRCFTKKTKARSPPNSFKYIFV